MNTLIDDVFREVGSLNPGRPVAGNCILSWTSFDEFHPPTRYIGKAILADRLNESIAGGDFSFARVENREWRAGLEEAIWGGLGRRAVKVYDLRTSTLRRQVQVARTPIALMPKSSIQEFRPAVSLVRSKPPHSRQRTSCAFGNLVGGSLPLTPA